MNEQELKKASEIHRQLETFRKARRDLEHYNRKSDAYASSVEHRGKWWQRLGRLFESTAIDVGKNEISVDPISVYGRVRFDQELGHSDEMKYEVGKSRARILGCMIEEAKRLEALAEKQFNEA